MIRILCLLLFVTPSPGSLRAQKAVSTADFDIYIKDTLRLDVSQMELLKGTDPSIQKTLRFEPKTDGFKAYYYISGNKNCEGHIVNKLKEGSWTSWYDSGCVSSKIVYKNNIRDGACTYWYRTGQLNATGSYKGDLKEGEWLFFEKDGSIKVKLFYKQGVIQEQ